MRGTGWLARLRARREEPDVYVLFAEFTAAHRTSAWEALVPLVDRLFPGRRVRYVVVDNAFERDGEVPPLEGGEVLAGDRSHREFSALDKAIGHVRRKYDPPARSVFVLANDTFHRSYGSAYLELFTRRGVRAALRRDRVVGYVDCYPREVEVLGLPVRCWIRTSLVIANLSVLDRLGALAIPARDEEIFGGVEQFLLESAPLSDNYRRYIRAWLFGEEAEDFSERWHSMQPLTQENLGEFEAKARSILCEHYLSARLRARRIGLSRVN